MNTVGSKESPSTTLIGQSKSLPFNVETYTENNHFIREECGSAKGELYLKKFGKASDGKTRLKYGEDFVSLTEIESAGGRKGQAWRKSIQHKEKLLPF